MKTTIHIFTTQAEMVRAGLFNDFWKVISPVIDLLKFGFPPITMRVPSLYRAANPIHHSQTMALDTSFFFSIISQCKKIRIIAKKEQQLFRIDESNSANSYINVISLYFSLSQLVTLANFMTSLTPGKSSIGYSWIRSCKENCCKRKESVGTFMTNLYFHWVAMMSTPKSEITCQEVL